MSSTKNVTENPSSKMNSDNQEDDTKVLPNTGESENNATAYALLLAALGTPLVLSNRRKKSESKN